MFGLDSAVGTCESEPAMNEALREFLSRTRVLIPAFNEEASLPGLLAEVRAQLPGASVAVVDDGSTDGTADVARACGARVLRLPCNLGVGPAVQTGFKDALECGCDYLIRMDGDTFCLEESARPYARHIAAIFDATRPEAFARR